MFEDLFICLRPIYKLFADFCCSILGCGMMQKCFCFENNVCSERGCLQGEIKTITVQELEDKIRVGKPYRCRLSSRTLDFLFYHSDLNALTLYDFSSSQLLMLLLYIFNSDFCVALHLPYYRWLFCSMNFVYISKFG